MDQFINEEIYRLLNILLQVILWSLIVSAPAIILTVEMYAYERYKKWKDKSEQELERIIVGKTNNKEELQAELKEMEEDRRKLELDVKLINTEKVELQRILGLPGEHPEEPEVESSDVIKRHQTTGKIELIEEPEEEKIDLKSMNIKQLHELAKQHNVKWYSRMKKDKLIEVLEPLCNSAT